MKRIISILTLMFVLLSFSACAHIPAPEITKAEFPFEIVYEIDGEIKVIDDVFVCEYEGIEWNEGHGRYRQWKGYVKSSGKDHVVLLEDGNLKFACKVGTAAYYMGDPSMANAGEYAPSIYYIRTFESGGVSSGVAGIEPLLEEYKLKLISWKLSRPIENYFK